NAPLPQRGGGGGRGRSDEPGTTAGAGRARAEAPSGPIGPRAGATFGNQVFKFSPDGKVLLTRGKPGGAAAPGYFHRPRYGVRWGSIKTGKIEGFIPDPEARTRAADNFTGTSAAEGVAVDNAGNIYGAEVGPKAVKKYVRK